MDGEFDKILNRKSGFEYATLDAGNYVRLLRLSSGTKFAYTLEVFPISELPWASYRALSYTWGAATSLDDVHEIQVNGQQFYIRRNLFDFLAAAAAKGLEGLLFIDAICINQLDHEDRRCQVQHMTSIYRNATEVITWLGRPALSGLASLQVLRGACAGDYSAWTEDQWAGFRFICNQPYWSRVWVVQEVLLAPRISIWCGDLIFPLVLLGAIPQYGATSQADHVTYSSSRRKQSPAEIILTHRLRPVLRTNAKDPLAQGTEVGTLEMMLAKLQHPSMTAGTYQSTVPDLLYELMHKFRDLKCSDPRDKLYGLLGILNKRSAAGVQVDYSRGVEHACYQAFKVGLRELYNEYGVLARRSGCQLAYQTFYCDVRVSFDLDENEASGILRRVLDEGGFRETVRDLHWEAQWMRLMGGSDEEVGVVPFFKGLLLQSEEEAAYEAETPLCKFHERQRQLLDTVRSRLGRGLSRRKRGSTIAGS